MKRKSLITIITMTIIALIFIVIFSINSKTRSSEFSDLKFADNYFSLILEEDQTITLNLFGALDESVSGPSYFDSINFLSLNNENIEIVEYEISHGGFYVDEHQLFNILLDVKVNSKELEEATELTINHDKNEEVTFDFGKLNISDADGFNLEELDLTGNNMIGAPKPSLEFELVNQTTNNITLLKVHDLIDNLEFEFDNPQQIDGNSTQLIEIPRLNEQVEYDFYTISPIIEYISNDETKQFYMPGTVFGIMDEDSEKMKKILN